MSALSVGSAFLIAAIGGWPFVGLIAILSLIGSLRFGPRMLIHIPLAVIAALWVNRASPPAIDPAASEQYAWRLEVTSMPAMRAQGWSFDAKIRDGAGAGESILVYTFDDHSVVFGDEIYVTGVLQPRESLDEPSYRAYLDGRGASAQIYAGSIEIDRQGSGLLSWMNRERQRIVRRAMNAAPGDAGSLIAGLVTGDDGKLTGTTDQEFKNAGLTHLTAVSGANLAFAVAIAFRFGRVTGRRRQSIFVVGLALAWFYAVFVGLSPPTLRAALLTTVVIGGRVAGRPIDPFSLAISTAVMQLILRPQDAFSISFLLSVVASIGLSAGLGRYPREAHRPLTSWIGAAIYAQVATAIVIGTTFGRISLLSIFANIVAAPIMVIAFPFSCLELFLLRINERIGEAFMPIARIPIDLLLYVARIYGQDWQVASLPSVDERLMLTGVMVVLCALAGFGGEWRYLGRNLRRRRLNYAGSR